MATVITGKILAPPYRVTFMPASGQRVFNLLPGDISPETDINGAKQILMYADGILVGSADHSITGSLQITSDDPQGVGANPGWDANSIEFLITFI